MANMQKTQEAQMKLRTSAPIFAATVLVSLLPVAASAQSVRIETTRICRDSDGDRIPCERRIYREREYSRERYRDRDRDGPSVSITRRGVRIDPD